MRCARSFTGYRVVLSGDIFIADCDYVDPYEKSEEIVSLGMEYDLIFRIYKTTRGARAICINEKFMPRSKISVRLLFEFGADTLYEKLVYKQNAYGARISAKPTVLGITENGDFGWDFYALLPRDQKAWVEKYEAIAQNYKVCELICQSQEWEMDEDTKKFVEYHDKECKISEDLPFA